ncbi:uncharacterized protein N7500_008441, partial [Penicillium coprophilum]|uniref:uncharacterized protein n=1 Tax=Penicillium coprophilum TaxID=36646 RepID=UPI0023A65D62
LLRFPRVKSIYPKYADKKVVIEVEALSLIRERISIANFILQIFEINFDRIGSLPTLRTTYKNRPFKLIYNNFGLVNIIIKSEKDLIIIRVIDLKWWLLYNRLVNEEWDFKDSNPPEATK